MHNDAAALLVLTLSALVAAGPLHAQDVPRIRTTDVDDHMGEEVTVCGGVFDISVPPAPIARPTIVKLGGPYPNRIVNVVIAQEDRHEFPREPEVAYANDDVCVTGTLRTYDRGPSIVIRGPEAVEPWDRSSGQPVGGPSRGG